MPAMTRYQARTLIRTIRAMQTTIGQACAGKTSITWQEIGDAIRANHIVPEGGWMVPRSALQGLIDAGVLTRTKDVMSETYEVKS